MLHKKKVSKMETKKLTIFFIDRLNQKCYNMSPMFSTYRRNMSTYIIDNLTLNNHMIGILLSVPNAGTDLDAWNFDDCHDQIQSLNDSFFHLDAKLNAKFIEELKSTIRKYITCVHDVHQDKIRFDIYDAID